MKTCSKIVKIGRRLSDCRSINKIIKKKKVPGRKLPCRMASAGEEHRETNRQMKTKWQKRFSIFLLDAPSPFFPLVLLAVSKLSTRYV